MERAARRIVDDARDAVGVSAGVAREIALVLEQLDHTRALHAWYLEQVLADECAIGTELALVEDLFPPYSTHAARLRARLLVLAVERRARAATLADQVAAHHRLLLELVERYRVLDPPDAD